ncbi:MAG: anti-sigma factor antagonist [Chrysiogenales bacterium]|nr:MAG: anti-sigma factor antagonist [Chrysiogenales bacterium]
MFSRDAIGEDRAVHREGGGIPYNLEGVQALLTIESQEKKDALIIYLRGEMVFNELDDADSFFREKLVLKPRVIAIDCRQLQTLDSSGLGLLIRFTNEAARADVRIVFVDITGQISALFDVSKLGAIFEIMSSSDFHKTYLA